MTGAICGAVVGGVMGFGKSIRGIHKSNKKVIENFNKELKNMSRNYSYAQNELDKDAVYAYDEAVNEIYQNSLNAFRNNSMVDVALGESGLEGRSQQQVSRDVHGQTERANANIQSSFENAIYSIKSSKDSLYVEYVDNVDNLRNYYNNSGFFTKGIQGVMQIADATAQGAAIGYLSGGLGGSFVSGIAGGGTAGGFSSATMSSAGSMLMGTGAGTTGASFGGATVSGAGSMLMGAGSGASSTLGSGLASFGGSTVSGAGSTLMSAGSSSGLWSTLGSALGRGWSNMASNWSTYKDTTEKFLNYYNKFTSPLKSYVSTSTNTSNRYRSGYGGYGYYSSRYRY